MKAECIYCGAKVSAPDEYIGKKVHCLKCKQTFVLGESQERSPATPKQNTDPPVRQTERTIQNHTANETRRKTTGKMAKSFDIPQKFKQYMHKEEVVLFASNPSKTVLILSLVLPVLFLFSGIVAVIFARLAGGFIGVLFWGFVCLFVYLS
jgi:hypothetical protein